ncbi:MAG: 1-deoxy-D-xylulose-5-phosphate reductoisomerase [Candidatus Omnitrophica bacterium]|nr:1-deoxy-D-xylulose-5-phosphate reductoisomerase [Candidatus Omnitrophota bacterium]
MRRVAVLGSTGSIGRNTLDVIASHPDELQLIGIAARSRVDLLAQQLAQFAPAVVSVWEEEKARELSRLTGRSQILVGPEGLMALATDPRVDVVVVATSGHDALIPLIRAIQAGKRIALASKELLVMAGELIMRLVKEHGTSLVPIDSEHAALFQCLQGVDPSHIERLVITGSGGALWMKTPAALQTVTRDEVLAHPKWQMGRKITVDSATLMNKGLEVIEARWLFGVPLERIRIVIHPEAAIHALIELVDGTIMAQMSPCDMRLPIQYALSFPTRWANALPRLSLTQMKSLRFFEPDLTRFPCLRLALQAARAGGSACVVLNGANDVAVHAYLDDQIAFLDIPTIIEETLEQHTPAASLTLDEVLSVDAWARRTAQERILQWSTR